MRTPFKNIGNLIDLLKRAFREWNSHEAPRMGAALAFYTVLSLAPLVIVVVGIVALAFGQSSAQSQLLEQFRQMIGDDGARAVETVLKSAQKPASGIIANAIGLITLLFGASGVFVELQSAMNKLWDVKPKESGGIVGMIKDRFLSFGMVLAIGFLLLASLTVSAALGAAGKFLGGLGIFPAWLLEAVNFGVSLAVVSGIFALIFRYVPDTRIPWNAVWNGAIATAVLFTIGKTAIGMYLGKAGVGSAYGAAGSLVVLVVWVYYSAQIFFFGAEFTHVVAGAHGPAQEQPEADAKREPSKAAGEESEAVRERAPARRPAPKSAAGVLAGAALVALQVRRALGAPIRRRRA